MGSVFAPWSFGVSNFQNAIVIHYLYSKQKLKFGNQIAKTVQITDQLYECTVNWRKCSEELFIENFFSFLLPHLLFGALLSKRSRMLEWTVLWTTWFSIFKTTETFETTYSRSIQTLNAFKLREASKSMSALIFFLCSACLYLHFALFRIVIIKSISKASNFEGVSEKVFRKESIQFTSRSFSLLLILPMTRRFCVAEQNGWCPVWIKWVGSHRD